MLFSTFIYAQDDLKDLSKDLVARKQVIIGGKECSTGVTKKWTSPPGFFKQTSVSQPTRCSAGFWCPENAFQPRYCCDGFYCKTPDDIKLCPTNFYCPLGTVDPLPCLYLSICPAGTKKPQRFAILIIIFVIMIILSVVFSIKKKFDIQTAIKNRIQVEHIKKDRRSVVQQMSTNELTIDIEFEDLSYSLADGTPILNNISGFLQSGKMVAVMGPSGSGKSTLFNLLTGKVKRTKGTFLLNGKKEELEKYRKLMGYVPQDDIMLKELTVDQILTHSASMRLPSKMNHKAKRKKVLEVISYLGLKSVINSQIGNEQVRGISGGQRKRVNIGMELVADPSILFLDEPTTGLDSSTAVELALLLNKLAKDKKITITAIIHSPNPQVFYQFDDVLFLGRDGKVVYFGPSYGVEHYFKELGFKMTLDNPADFAIDILSGKIPSEWDPDFKPTDLSIYWEYYQQGKDIHTLKQSTLQRKKTIQRPKIQKNIMNNLQDSVYQILVDYKDWCLDVLQDFNRLFSTTKTRSTPNFITIYLLLLKRAFIQLLKSPRTFLLDALMHFIGGIVVSIAVQDLTYIGKLPDQVCDLTVPNSPTFDLCTSPTDSMNQAFSIVVFGILFTGHAAAVPTFSLEKTVYYRDRSSGMSALAYFLAKITADIPRIVFAALFYTLSLLVFFDYRSSILWIYVAVLLVYISSFHMGYFLSILLPKENVLLFCAASSLLWGLLFQGVTPDYSKVSSFGIISWIWEISAPRYGVELFYIFELAPRKWFELQDPAIPWGHGYDRDNFKKCVGGLIGVAIMWAVFSILALKLYAREKQK